MRIALSLLLCAAALPTIAQAQEPVASNRAGGAQVMQRSRARARQPIAAQFDSLGIAPMAAVGDTVTIYYFADGANLGRLRHARISRRQRLVPPEQWRLACDDVAHPGWLFSLDAPATSAFAVVVPGRHGLPVRRDPPPAARAGAAAAYRLWADSTWRAWLASMPPRTDRQVAYLRGMFWGARTDAGYAKQQHFGVMGPGNRRVAVFSTWLHDDHDDGRQNTTGTWVVDGWGTVLARAPGKVDIYGTTDPDGDGIEDVVTSRGVIYWDGTAWRFPAVYSEEPCLLHQVMSPPPGRRD